MAVLWGVPLSVFDAGYFLRKTKYNMEKRLIIHADDIGMSQAANEAAMGALDYGVVTSGSIMVPCPWFPEAAAYAREHPERDLGVHLTLTSEWRYYRWKPVAPSVPGLIDEEGYMWRSVAQVATKATAEEVERELRAQIERAIEFGIKPTHFDTHMGTTFARADYFEVYVQLGKEYGVPVMLPRPTPEMLEYARTSGLPVPPERLSQLEAEGAVMLDTLVTSVAPPPPISQGDDKGAVMTDYLETFGAETALEQRKRSYHELLRTLKPGLTQLIIHPGTNAPELQAITGSWEERYNDFLCFTDPQTRALIADLGITLTTWRDESLKLQV